MAHLNFDGKSCAQEVKFKSLYCNDEPAASNPISFGAFKDDEFKKNDEQIMRSLDCLASMNGANINFRKYNQKAL